MFVHRTENGRFPGEYAGSGDASVLDIARHAARAGGKSLRMVDLPVPDNDEWCWNDVVEALARCAVTREVRGAITVTGCVTSQGWGVHFCNDPLLSGINSNLWFPLDAEEDWFAGIERILTMNGVAENVVKLVPLLDNETYRDWKVIYNRKVID